MKIFLTLGRAAVAALCLCCPPATAGNVGKFVCTRVSGGPMSSFAMTIDFDAKSVDVPSSTGLALNLDPAEITKNSVHWSFMRGTVDFDRRTGKLDWDTTSKYAYLQATNSFSHAPEKDYKGSMQCVPDRPSH